MDSILKAVADYSITDIVMSSHGRTGLSRVIVCSLAETLVHHLTCPILIIPALAAKQMEAATTEAERDLVPTP